MSLITLNGHGQGFKSPIGQLPGRVPHDLGTGALSL